MKKSVSGILLISLLASLSILMFNVQPVKAPTPTTISVVFENGLNTITKTLGSNFTVSINIATTAYVGLYVIGIQWDPSALELRDNNTNRDVIEGPWMKAFGHTTFSGPFNANLTAGIMPDIGCGLSSGSATGNGTMFTVAFHAKAPSSATNITIMSPNEISVLSLNLDIVNIDAVFNGQVHVPAQSIKYAVTFTESGLPSGTKWGVTFNGQTQNSTSNSITFNATNGIYAFSIISPAGYTPDPSSGNVTVNGANVTQPVTTFTPVAEFGSFLILSLFMLATLLGTLIFKKKRKVAQLAKS